MQPVHYLNSLSKFSEGIHNYIQYAFDLEDLPDELYNEILLQLSFIKPLRGEMSRRLSTGTIVHFLKNFHDENEWRFVPESDELKKSRLERVIVNPNISSKKNDINELLETEKYQNLWLRFSYEDIKYLIVPNSGDRLDLIKYINNIPYERFSGDSSVDIQKFLLISRILVLDEIRGDW